MSNQDNVVRISPVKSSADDANDAEKKYSEDQSMTSRMNLYTDDCCPSSSVNEEVELKSYFDFDQLPIEVFEMIFNRFYWKERLRYRLVCQSWHERITHSAIVPLEITYKGYRRLNQTKNVERLAQCNFKSLGILFTNDYSKTEYMCDFPLSLWEKLGPKICALNFNECHLGDLVMKEIFLNCGNLKYLTVSRLKNAVPTESFCSLSMLESLENVVSKNLKKFEIRKPLSTTCNPIIWTSIFEAFFRLFPTLSDFTCCGSSYYGSFHWTFEREINKNEELTLATIVARSLSGTFRDSMRAIYNLATLSLKKVDLYLAGHHQHFTKDVEVTFVNFFGSQGKLEDVCFELYNSGVDLEAIYLKIVRSCPDLRQLYFHPRYINFSWLNHVQEYTSTSKLQKLSIGPCIEITPNSLRITKHAHEAHVMCILSKYANITYLSIEISISNEMLQSIFQHMINLKTLKMLWTNRNTDFALTGRQGIVTENAPTGYSINCLQNLERLEIECEYFRRKVNYDSKIPLSHHRSFRESLRAKYELSNNIYREFRFPKLQYFSCIPPEDPALLANFGIEMPLLKKVKFFPSYTISLKVLVDLCQSTKNLHTIFLDESRFDLEEAKVLFHVCPSLQIIHSAVYEYFYEPFTKQIREDYIPNRYLHPLNIPPLK